MRDYVKGLMSALEVADQIDIHWTEDERDEALNRAYAGLERARRTHDGRAESVGFIEGIKQAAPRLDGHNWTPLNLGGACLICETLLQEEAKL